MNISTYHSDLGYHFIVLLTVIVEQSQSSTSTTYTGKCGNWRGVDDETLTFGDKQLTKKCMYFPTIML